MNMFIRITHSYSRLVKVTGRYSKVWCSSPTLSVFVLRDLRQDGCIRLMQMYPRDECDARGYIGYTETARHGDMIFENMSLFLRDALILYEFNDAIKGGYSGRIIRVLKVLALMYRGSGRTKYAHELLHLIHNLTHVWPKPLR